MKKLTALLLALTLCGSMMAGCGEQAGIPGSSAESSAVSAETMSLKDYLDLGEKYLLDGNYEEAIIAYTAAIQIDPKSPDAYIGRAQSYVAQAKSQAPEGVAVIDWPEELIYLYKMAENDYLQAIAIDAQATVPYKELADLYLEQGELEKALDLLKNGAETTQDEELLQKQAEVEEELSKPRPLKPKKGYPKTVRTEEEDGSYAISEYNAYGKLIQWNVYRADGSLDEFIVFEYDAYGNPIKDSYYHADGSLDFYAIYEYDADGKRIRLNEYYANGGLRNYAVYEYDADGNKIKESSYNADGKRIKDSSYHADGSLMGYTVNEYDADGNKIKASSYHADGSLDYYWIFEYNAYGILMATMKYNADGTPAE